MKLLGQLLVWGSLAVGAAAAATGYLVALDADDEMLIGLTLAAPAGKIDPADVEEEPTAESDQEIAFPDGEEEPGSEGTQETASSHDEPNSIAKGDEKITAQMLTDLRGAGVRNVRVKEFSVRRWRGKWFFLAAVGGLLFGAFLTRAGERAGSVSRTGEGRTDSPRQTLAAMRTAIDDLTTELAQTPDLSRQLDAVVGGIGRLQKTDIPAFAEARSELVSELGLAGYATLMDSFAAAERQLNRAWSAAVDGAGEEAFACVEEALPLLEEAEKKLGSSATLSADQPMKTS